MKKGKLLFTLSALSLMLVSCGGGSMYGTYSFIMGKSNSTGINASMNLKEDLYTTENLELIKYFQDNKATPRQFTFSLKVTGMAEDEENPIEILEKLYPDGFNGYYFTEQLKDVTKLNIGAELGEEYKSYIPAHLIDDIIYATIEGKYVNLAVPVSLDDIQMNLAWYGYYVNFDNPDSSLFNLWQKLDFENSAKSKSYEHKPGEKVTQEGVDAMNEDFLSYFCNAKIRIPDGNGGYTSIAGVYNKFIKQGNDKVTKTYISYFPEYKAAHSGSISGTDVQLVYYEKELLSDIKVAVKKNVNLTLSSDGTDEVVAVSGDFTSIDKLTSAIPEKFTYRKAHVVNIGLMKE